MALVREIFYHTCGMLCDTEDLGEGGARVRSGWNVRDGESGCRWASTSYRYAVLSHRLGGTREYLGCESLRG